jgi:hypothetical protein
MEAVAHDDRHRCRRYLTLALRSSGLERVRVRHRPRWVRRLLQQLPLPRESEQPDPGRYLLRPRPNHPCKEAHDQTEDDLTAAATASTGGRLNCNPMGSTLSYSYAQLVQHVLTTYSGAAAPSHGAVEAGHRGV